MVWVKYVKTNVIGIFGQYSCSEQRSVDGTAIMPVTKFPQSHHNSSGTLPLLVFRPIINLSKPSSHRHRSNITNLGNYGDQRNIDTVTFVTKTVINACRSSRKIFHFCQILPNRKASTNFRDSP